MTDPLARMKQLYEAFARGDIETFVGALDDNVEWNQAEHETYWPGGPFIGPDAVVQGVFVRMGQTWGDTFAIDVQRMLGCGGTVVVQARLSGTVQSTGKNVSAQVAHIWDLDGEKIVRFQQYIDTWQMAWATESTPTLGSSGS